MAGPVSWLSPATIEALGSALMHFLWQGAAIAALAAMLMDASRRPRMRYVTGVAALALMLAMPVATFLLPDGVMLRAPSSAMLFRAASAMVASIPRPVLSWLVEGWLLGVALLSLRFAGGFLLLERKLRQQSDAPSEQVLALCRAVQQRLMIDRAIRYLECGWLQVPAVIGSLRPAVLLPVAALTGLSEAQLRAVIAHELAHVRRWDFLVNLFQILAETLLFYHPAVWWLNRRIRAERELCCDEIAVAEAGDGIEYARALALIAGRSAPGFAMAATNGILSERIFHILGRPAVKPRLAGLAASMVLFTASLAVACAMIFPGVPVSAVREAVRPVAAISGGPVADVESPPVRDIPDNAHAVSTRRPFHIRAIRLLPVSSLSVPLLIASADFTPMPAPVELSGVAPEMAASIPAPHPVSVVTEKLEAQNVAGNVYPAPALKLNASKGWQDWNQGEAIVYCKNFAVQTVTQGANPPILVDDGLKQRLSFFYWHCMLSNLQMVNAFGGDFGNGPAFAALGSASPANPVNVSGGWTLSLQQQASLSALLLTQVEAQGCNFTQSGNTINGTCIGRQGNGTVTGVIDGKQVRWVWTRQDGRHEAEVDFIGMVGPDGAITGQSIVPQDYGYRIIAFTATPGPGQVASRR
jgi:beta-lactamase regulating signal transducer with metallopeptidase domain